MHLDIEVSMTKSKRYIYLSGGMQHAEELGGVWRATCSERLDELGFIPVNITAMDIAYSKQYGVVEPCFEYKDNERHVEKKLNIRNHFVYADLGIIEDFCSALIVYYDESVRKGAGTLCECQKAYDHRIPVFLVNGYDSFDQVPGWLQGLTTKMFSSFEQLYQYLEQVTDNVAIRKDIRQDNIDSHLCLACGTIENISSSRLVDPEFLPEYCTSCNQLDTQLNKHTKQDRYRYFCNYLLELNRH